MGADGGRGRGTGGGRSAGGRSGGLENGGSGGGPEGGAAGGAPEGGAEGAAPGIGRADAAPGIVPADAAPGIGPADAAPGIGPADGGPVKGVLNPAASGGEARFDAALRPLRLDEFLGQTELKEKLGVFIGAAKKRGEALDHVLIHGHPGLGKTTLAHILSHEMGSALKKTTGPVIERPGDLASLLTNLESGDVLFIDEIHRLSPVVEEILYPAMEDFKLDLMIGQGPGARSVRLDLPPFTLVGATTRAGMLTSPLRDRFGIQLRLDYYSPAELALIVKRAADLLKARIDEGGADEIARRSRGTPRIAGRILRRVRDFAEFKSDGLIDRRTADKALAMLDVDACGLDGLDRRILEIICLRYSGGPVGLDTLATAAGEEAETIQEICEPYLIQEGFIHRGPRGRLATKRAFEHLGAADPKDAAGRLF